jgi:CubicO group peptidase (beta-lactamase class C family)
MRSRSCARRPGRRIGSPAHLLTAPAFALVLLAAGCSGAQGVDDGVGAAGTTAAAGPGTTVAPVRYPGAAWETTTPAEVGLDAAALAAIQEDLVGSGTDCVVVVKDGQVAYETTWDGFDADRDQIVWSVSKSLTSLLIGIAAEEGKLRIDQPAADFVTEWKGTPAGAVTIRHLLTMTSGRHFDYNTDFVVLPTQTDDQTAFSIGLAQDAAPDTVWVYSNSAVQVLDAVLTRATGTPTIDYAEQKLFAPLGIGATWLKDKVGQPWTYGGATMSCRELARVGYLMLHRGRWRDQQVVPEAWVAESVRPSQKLRSNYGLLWWLNTPEEPAPGRPADVQTGDRVPGLADNVYFARGMNGQFITVMPDDDMVVIRTGERPTDKARFGDEGKVLDHLLELVVKADQANPS